MVFIPIEGIGSVGVVYDLADHQLPPEAWTDALNIRFEDGKVKRSSGWGEVMEPPTAAPGFIMGASTGGDYFWIYAGVHASTAQVYAYNSGTHYNITQSTGYAAPNYRDWNGTMFQGVAVVNYGGGAPQYWAAYVGATDLADLPAWPANTTAKVVRAYKNYLMAVNIADAGGNYYHRVLWSDGAAPGTMPASWAASATSDAGSFELSDTNSGQILDAEALRDMFVVYKDDSTHLVRYVGGTLIMGNELKLQTSGILATRCVAPISLPAQKAQLHFLATGTDVGVFDGAEFSSVVSKKVRKYLNSIIDPLYYVNSFVFDHPTRDEAWFCYPENGNTNANMAMVWNYRDGSVTFRAVDFVAVSQGVVESDATATWDSISTTWDAFGNAKWQDASRRKVVAADLVSTHLLELELMDTFNGTSFSSYVERTGLAVIGQDRVGNSIVDYNRRKIVSRVWPKITGAPVSIKLGGKETMNADEEVTWGTAGVFDPADGKNYIDLFSTAGDPINTRFVAINFSSTGDEAWELHGYGLDIDVVGML